MDKNSEYYFRLASEEYADINLFFYLDKCVYSHIKTQCVGVKNGHFVTRAPIKEIERQPIIWGSEADGYFAVREQDIVPCNFKSRLARLYTAAPDSMYLVFPIPRDIDHNQRRFSRRVSPDAEQIEEIGIWHGEMQGGDFENLPALRWSALNGTQCELGEISANGLRLDVLKSNYLAEKIAINDLILLRGDFAPKSKPCPIFVLGRVVRKMPDREIRDIINIGCQFFSWRKVEDTRKQAWFRADPQEGVGMIAQWVSRNFRNVNL